MAKSVAAVSSLDVHPVAGRIGAEISGLRLSRQLSPQTVAAIRDVLLRYKVIFFRDQGHLDDALHEALARSFGDLVAHPTIPPLAGTGVILELDASRGGGRASYWHIDVTFAAAYPQASVLRAVVVPSHGGDTIWANTVAAYRVYETEHPIVRVHPETGERALVLGGFLQKLVGYSQTDSAHLIALLQAHVTRPENTVRWRWLAGDVAIWDNRATQHYAIDDCGNEPRIVRRVTVAGDVPIAVDGRRSVTRRRPQSAATPVTTPAVAAA